MKKRVLALAAAAALCLGLALPCSASQGDNYHFRSVAVTAQMHSDGTVAVTEVYDVVFSAPCSGFEREVYGNDAVNGCSVRDVSCSGTMAWRVERQYDSYACVAFGPENGTVTGEQQITLHYTLAYAADQEADADYFDFELFPYGLDADTDALSVELLYPETGVLRRYELTEGRSGSIGVEGVSCTQTDGGLALQSTQTLSSYTGLCLYAVFEPGLFPAQAESRADFVVSDGLCEVTVDSTMTYTIHQRYVIEANNRDTLLRLPTLAFEDYHTPYTCNTLSLSDGILDYDYDYDNNPTLYLDLQDQLGTFTVDYTYTLRPLRRTAPFCFRLEPPNWCDRADQFTFSMTAPGLSGARITEMDSILHSAQESRYTLLQSGDACTLRMNGPFYPQERLVFSASVDASLYSRPAGGGAWAAVICGLTALLLCALGRFFLGTPRRLAAVPETDAPNGISSAEVGYLLDGCLTNAELASLIPSWAAQGALTIEACGGDYVFRATGSLPQTAPAYEVELFRRMFAHGRGGYVTTVQLRGCFAPDVSAARLQLKAQYRGARALYATSVTRLLFFALAALPAAVLGFAGAFCMGAGVPLSVLAALGCTVMQCFLGLLCFPVFAPRLGALQTGPKPDRLLRIVCGVLLAALACGWVALLAHWMQETPLWVLVCVTALCLSGQAVSALFLQRTPATHALLCRVLGFRDYLLHAAPDALRAAQLRDPSYCYRLLPYAEVFGLTELWVQRFSELDAPAPQWFAGVTNAADCAARTRQLLSVLRSVFLPGKRG